MNDRFEYTNVEGLRGTWKVNVRLDGRLVGSITIIEGGFTYFPKGSRSHGDIFKSVREVQRSLESGGEELQS